MMIYTKQRMVYWVLFFFQAEDGIRDLVRSRGLGDVYKRQDGNWISDPENPYISGSGDYINSVLVIKPNYSFQLNNYPDSENVRIAGNFNNWDPCLLYTSDAADERSRCRSRWSPYH